MNLNVQRLPSQSVESEQSLLGGLLIDNNALDLVSDTISEHDFYREDHKLIYRHISKLIEQGNPADIVTVAESMEGAGKLSEIGGILYLGKMAQNTAGTANIIRYAEIIRDKAILRGLTNVASEIQGFCINPNGKSPSQIAQDAELRMQQLVDRESGEPLDLQSILGEVLLEIDKRGEHGGGIAGLSTGFDAFDTLTGGFTGGQLIIIAARPSVGKTVFGLNIATHAAKQGHTVLFFSLELTRYEIGHRILSSEADISVSTMRDGTTNEIQWQKMTEFMGEAGKLLLLIDDKPAIPVGYIRAKARRIQRKQGLGLIVVDYLGLMKGVGDNRTQEIGSISRGLKALAKELNVPIIAMAQLNRGVESRQEKLPMASDLRDSGEVEQDADIIAMIHREELYDKSHEWQGVAELLIRKNRNGQTGEVLLNFNGSLMRFEAASSGKVSPRYMQTKQNSTPVGFYNPRK